MKSFKLAGILLCLALLSEQSHAVLNKNTKSSSNENHVSDQKTEKNAEDRISNEYGAPPSGFNGPAPVYGPPELTGNHGPVQVFPPPPAELPPPPPPSSFQPGPRPHGSYGPPSRNPPLQLQFAPRPGKPAPWRQPPPRFPANKPPGHGPPIPISLEAYGPPNNPPPLSFSSQNPFGPPPQLPSIPQPPPPGVPAPPTPPDIKYDGWQPIAGHIDNGNINSNPRLPTAPDHISTVNYPSDSYGEPINSADAHNLKQSIGQNGDGQGLPPPVLPESEPLHNIQEPIKDSPGLNAFEALPTASGLSASFNDLPPNHDNNVNHQEHKLFPQLPPPGPSAFNTYGPPSVSFGSGQFSTSHGSSHASSSSVPHISTHGFGFTPGFNPSPPRPNRPNSFRSPHPPRGPAPFRPPNGLPNSLIPPRSRAPLKFRDSVPPGLFNSVNHYLPPPSIRPGPSNKPANTYGPPTVPLPPPPPPSRFPLNLHQQPPALNNPFSFKSNAQSTSGFTSFVTSATTLNKSPLAAPNVNYGTPLFTNFNTPSPVLTYGAPNFVPANSFTTNIAQGNLYDQHTSLTTSYGSPLSPPPSNSFNGHQCSGYQKPLESSIFPSFTQGNGLSALPNIGDYPVPSINELELGDNHHNHQFDQKDSYGNPTGAGYDQRSASSVSQNILNNEATAEALTAALTEQGFRQASNDYNAQQSLNSYNQEANSVATNSVNINQLIQSQEDSEPALALAQTLSNEGASDGFQIQGSKGSYMLQIQSSNGLHQNGDGSIRHEQLLSNGLLQDILAAIEEPGDGKNQLIEIQGSPQTQQHVADNHQQDYGQVQERNNDDLFRAESSSIVSSNSAASNEDVALFFNNNYGNGSTKEVRSTAKSEGNVENSTKASEEKSSKESS